MALSTSLIAWWTLNEESGTRADSVGSNNLTDNATVLYGTGKVGNAADFELDNTEYLSIADNADLSFGNEDFTLACWIKAETLGANVAIMDKFEEDKREYTVWYDNTTDRFQFHVSDDGTASSSVTANNLGGPSTATWYCIIAWHDADANTINIQVNNGTVDSESYSDGCNDNTSAFGLGARPSLPAGNKYDGLMDEAAVWGKVLSAAERKRYYNGGDGLTYPFPNEVLAGSFVATGTVTKKPKKALAGVVAFAGTITSKLMEGIWRFKARFHDYFLTAPQKFTILSSKIQLTARYRDYYFTAPKREKHG